MNPASNLPRANLKAERRLGDLIAQAVAAHSQRVAVRFDGRSVSFGVLDSAARALASRLQACGIEAGAPVGVCLDRSVELITALVGVVYSGAAYVPLDPDYPSERLAGMCKDAGIRWVITGPSEQARVDGAFAGDIAVLSVEGFEPPTLHPDERAKMPLVASACDPVYLIFTSGSTGRPKGAANSHRGVVNYLETMRAEFAVTEHDVYLQKAPTSFDASVREIFLPLVSGACVVLAKPGGQRDHAYIAQLVRDEGVTLLGFVPSMLRGFVETPGIERCTSLRQVFSGGEALTPELVERFFEHLPKAGLANLYGPTECGVSVTAWRCVRGDPRTVVPIGRPMAGSSVVVLGADLRRVDGGATGELAIGGLQVGLGYVGRDELTAERFIADPDPEAPEGARIYRTGDLGRVLPGGEIECLGRLDHQVKVRGFRIELGEIEAALQQQESVALAAVLACEFGEGDRRLVAYVSAKTGTLDMASLRAGLAAVLPDFMLPAQYVELAEMPLLANGKLDRKSLPAPGRGRPDLSTPFEAPRSPAEVLCCGAFESVLGLEGIGCSDNFFDLGGDSLLAVRVLERIAAAGGAALTAPTIFASPTAAGLARFLEGGTEVGFERFLAQRRAGPRGAAPGADDGAIAIIGMAGRFPGADCVDSLWRNLLSGVDGITRFSDAELDASVPASLRHDSNYVRARGVIAGADLFDARFFGMSPLEASITDPQHRVFLEIAWECLERAGYAPDRVDAAVGVFAGVSAPTYLRHHVMAHPDVMERVGELQVRIGNDKDYAATRVSNKLGLRGPAMAVNTACSTSLVAIAQAVDSLRLGRCEMALAGGASITCPPQSGYLYIEGAMLSRDGHTRSFDAAADGTVFGDGAAVVLLKRLSSARADGDPVIAVIRGVALNNDGGGKASFTAPSVNGQAEVIALAHQDAGVDPRTISYVEAHGTATPLGDPVEVEALTRAFRRGTQSTGFCRLGSVKSNIGHTVSAAGAAGVIKTALALQHQVLPATLHFERANPKIDFAGSPFVVQAVLSAWPRSAEPRRAGVSSFGVGGTNAHAVLEEAPLEAPDLHDDTAAVRTLMLSARSEAALDAMSERLAQHLSAQPGLSLRAVAWTLERGRSRFAHRLAVAASTTQEAVQALRQKDHLGRSRRQLGARVPEVALVFPGQGAQYAGMGRELYAHEAVFRAAFDECAEAVQGDVGLDVRQRLFHGDAAALSETALTQPATFCLEYALARLWLSRGLKPALLIGHSIGEFVAATLAGVMTAADAARLVARRGALMQALPNGGMLSVRAPADRVLVGLPHGLDLAAENGPTSCVVAGPQEVLDAYALALEAQGLAVRALQTSHAFHSAMMAPAVAPFEALVRGIVLSAPRLPIVSTLTGQRLSDAEATDATYWARHLREPMRFSPAVRTALESSSCVFLEVGPRGSLSTLVRQHARPGVGPALACPSLGDSPEGECRAFAAAVGWLWTLGVELPSEHVHAPRRVLLPTYPFERKRHWLESRAAVHAIDPPTTPHRDLVASQATQSVACARAMPQTPMPAPQATDSSARIAQLTALIEEVAGIDLSAADPAVSFIELGLDSLTLTQIAIQIKRSFSVNITFRQLMESFRSLETLARHLDDALPAAPVAARQPPAPAAAQPAARPANALAPSQNLASPLQSRTLDPAPGPVSAHSELLQRVIAQQMQLMAQQLALLGGQAAAPMLAAASPLETASAVGAASASSVVPASPPAQPRVAAPSAANNRMLVEQPFGASARIALSPTTQLTAQQQQWLDAFTARYNARTGRSKAFSQKYRKRMADPRVVTGFNPLWKDLVYPIVVERSKGARLWDLDGNEYVDLLSCFGANLQGYQPEHLLKAMVEQLQAGIEVGPQHPLAAEVAELISEFTGMERVAFCNTGSEAVMGAMRTARTVTGRKTIAIFTNSYHGIFDEVVVRGTKQLRSLSAAPGILANAVENILVLDYASEASLAVLRERGHELAAIMIEPVQNRLPTLQPREFVHALRKIADDAGCALIFDEVITGFRIAPGGAQEFYGVRADIATYGKVIGGGLPFAAIAGASKWLDALDGGHWQYGDESSPEVGVTYFAGTFVRHPLALAAARASLLHLKAGGRELYERLNSRTQGLVERLNTAFSVRGAPVKAVHFASSWRLSWDERQRHVSLFYYLARFHGLHLYEQFGHFVTEAIGAAEADLIFEVFTRSLDELMAQGFITALDGTVAVLPPPAGVAKGSAGSVAKTFDASRPPVPGARLGKDPDGMPAWYVANPEAPGKFIKVDA